MPVAVNAGLGVSFGGNVYWGLDVYYLFNAPPGYPVPVATVLFFNGFDNFSHKLSALYFPLGSNAGAAVFGYGIVKGHFILSYLLEATINYGAAGNPIAQAQASLSAGYVF